LPLSETLKSRLMTTRECNRSNARRNFKFQVKPTAGIFQIRLGSERIGICKFGFLNYKGQLLGQPQHTWLGINQIHAHFSSKN
jgi:hypothetical protein